MLQLNFSPSVLKVGGLKLAENISEYLSQTYALDFCTILTVWSGFTFQGLQHAASGVGQQSSFLLQLVYSITQRLRGSTRPTWRNLGFEAIQLFLQSQQVLNTSVVRDANEGVKLRVIPDPNSLPRWKPAPSHITASCWFSLCIFWAISSSLGLLRYILQQVF